MDDTTTMTDRVDQAVLAAGEVIEDGLRQAIDFDAGLAAVYADASEQGRETTPAEGHLLSLPMPTSDGPQEAGESSGRQAIPRSISLLTRWLRTGRRGVGRGLRMLVGVDEELLRYVPTERHQYNALGGQILSTATIAGFSMIVALSQVLGHGSPVIVPSAIVWALFVLSLDRWLLSSSTSARWTRRMSLLLPRFVLALLLGVLIAEPLILRVFQPAIEQELASHQGPIGLLEQLQTLDALMSRSTSVQVAVWILRGLFILISCLPVLTKFSVGPTTYDRLVEQQQQLAERVRAAAARTAEASALADLEIQLREAELMARMRQEEIDFEARRHEAEINTQLDEVVDTLAAQLRPQHRLHRDNVRSIR
jgi:Domain of unknown function (DUF4407)